jgi:hypothetical protein
VAASPRVRSEMSGSEEKIDGFDTMLEGSVPLKIKCLFCLMEVHIYRGAAYPNPSPSRLRRRGRSDCQGWCARGNPNRVQVPPRRTLMGRARPHAGGGLGPMYL